MDKAKNNGNKKYMEAAAIRQRTLSGEKQETGVQRPSLYEIFLLDDDYTSMDFVIDVLQRFFHVSASEATGIMLEVHRKGKASCGVFTRDIAETKVIHVTEFAREQNFPLKCVMQKSPHHVIKKS